MVIEIDEQKMMTEILERDASLHREIKDKVRDNLIQKVTDELEAKFIDKGRWGDSVEQVEEEVLRELSERQEELVKKILKQFYDSYRYGKTDLTILKKLKEFIGADQ